MQLALQVELSELCTQYDATLSWKTESEKSYSFVKDWVLFCLPFRRHAADVGGSLKTEIATSRTATMPR